MWKVGFGIQYVRKYFDGVKVMRSELVIGQGEVYLGIQILWDKVAIM